MANGFKVICAVLMLLCASCSSLYVSPVDKAERLAAAKRWSMRTVYSAPLSVTVFAPQIVNLSSTRKTVLIVFLEGDGYAWAASNLPSEDPTPKRPVGLELALEHPGFPVVYLARPCQFRMDSLCSSRYWTSDRYSADVIQSSSSALDILKMDFGAEQLVLVGYSGGGVVAAELAAMRDDVIFLVTVAGNLDHAAWTRLHQVSPLSGSANPADAWQRLLGVKQVHLVGSADRIVPYSIVRSYGDRFPQGKAPKIMLIEGFDHQCCWVEHWTTLWENILKELSNQALP